MKFNIRQVLFSVFFLTLTLTTMAQIESYETVKYFTSDAMRDGSNTIYLQKGKNNGVKVMALSDTNGNPAGLYEIAKDSTEAYGKDVYVGGGYGILFVPYDDESYVMLVPDESVALGYGVWKTFMYANFLSTNKAKAKSISVEDAKKWAADLSKRIMTTGIGTESTTVDANTTEYYPIIKKMFAYGGKRYSKVNIVFDKKTLKVSSLDDKEWETYYYRPGFSKALGVEIYGDNSNRGQVAFVESPSSVIVVDFDMYNGLGHYVYSDDTDLIEYYHKNQQSVRQVLASEEKQADIDNRLIEWTKKAIAYQDGVYETRDKERTANNELPKRGLRNSNLEAQALKAARNWAARDNWEETVTNAYFTGDDWSIVRNTRTGIQIKRVIGGVIVMKRKDGLCSYHHANFAQEYNGSSYQKVYTESIVPGQNKLDCSKVW